ncbi:MAG: phosphatase PAP2 family protein [Cyanobacteria bacterium J007]|nr:MAG: phosphatase PAP2 family protein [Cyanobacteria bacterium J007]
MDIITWVRAFFTARSLPIFIAVSALGSESAYIVFLTLYYWLFDPDRARQLGMLLGVSYGVNTGLKTWVDAPRPFVDRPDLAFPEVTADIDDASFPSGHAQGAATFWVYLARSYQRPWLWIVAVLLIAAIALSRIYLGVHYFLDVLGGVLFGTLFAWIWERRPFPEVRGRSVKMAIVGFSFFLSIILPSLGRACGVFAAFFLTRPQFIPPQTRIKQLLFAGVGLILIFGIYKGSQLLFDRLDLYPWLDYFRFLGLVLVATELWPRLMLKIGQCSPISGDRP